MIEDDGRPTVSLNNAKVIEDIAQAIPWPKHKAGMLLTHNENRGYYTTVEQEIRDEPDRYKDWVSPQDRDRSISDNEIWSLQWYPETPVGFCVIHAATFESLLTWLAAYQETEAKA